MKKYHIARLHSLVSIEILRLTRKKEESDQKLEIVSLEGQIEDLLELARILYKMYNDE